MDIQFITISGDDEYDAYIIPIIVTHDITYVEVEADEESAEE